MRTNLWRYLRRHHLAFLALFVALGGTSYAASQIPANSVGTKQIMNKAVTLRKIDIAAQRALRGHTGSVGLTGSRGLAGVAGSAGKDGLPGVHGTNGINGANSATHVVVRTGSATVSAGPDQLGDAQANCNPGEHATGGGEFISPSSAGPVETIRFSAPTVQSSDFIQPAGAGVVPDAWGVEVLNNAASAQLLYVYVVCASP